MSNNPYEMFEQTQAFTKMWTDMATKMWGGMMNMQPTTPPPDAARDMRNNMFQAMSQFFDQWMRNPQMLEWMRQSMDMGIAFRKQMNDFLTRARHQTQGTTSEDIDSLMATMRHLENRVLERLDEITDRLAYMDERLDVIETDTSESSSESNGHAVRSRRRYTRGSSKRASESRE